MKDQPCTVMSTSTKRCDANIPIADLTEDVRSFIAKLEETHPRVAYLKEQVWSKFVSELTDPPEIRKSRAIEKWLACEVNNEATNERLVSVDPDYQIIPRVTYSQFMDKLSSFVEQVIGPVPPDEALFGGFSGGASTSRNRTESAPAEKFVGQAHVTTRTRSLARQVMGEAACWSSYVPPIWYLEAYESNQMFTVPKNTTIDRCACKEPDFNMYIQKGLGNEIRRCLRAVGINLNDQSINQRLARQGSIDGSLATLDLSSASDSVTRELVFQALPITWFCLLDSTRSETTLIGGECHVNEMFSSMGNGFTFELESLLFYAIARTVCYFEGIKGIVSVYGDDIIAPTACVSSLVTALEFLGFTVNSDKSFWDGPFRESCGGHYHNGHDITPFFIRRPLNRLTEVILLANNVRKFASLDGIGVLCPVWLPLWEYLAGHVPEEFWGGRELGSPYQLVSYNRPKSVLSPRTQKRDYGIGGYLHWLSTCEKRDSKPVTRPGRNDLRLVLNTWDPSAPNLLVFGSARCYYYDVPHGGVETSSDTDVAEFCEIRKARKRNDVPWPTPWVTPGVNTDSTSLV